MMMSNIQFSHDLSSLCNIHIMRGAGIKEKLIIYL